MKTKMNEMDWAAWMFVMIGAVNWGLVGLFQIDLVQVVFGTSPKLVTSMYSLIGVSGVYWIWKTVAVKK